MKSLKEQIESKCIHFNGIMNKSCKVGINYSDVRTGKPYKFPCLKQGGECLHSKFMTEDDVNKKIAEIENMGSKTLVAYTKIKEHYNNTKEVTGILKCDCGGELRFTVASCNGHIWAACSNCGIYFNE